MTSLARPTVPRPAKHYTEPDIVDVLGVPVAFRRKGSGTPVVFLHGAGFTRMWLPLYAQCAARADFIAPEHPGMGQTPFPEWLGGFNDLTLYYDRFFDAVGLDRFHLVGYSGGGWMAAEYASFFHKRLKSLVLLTPAGLNVPGQPVANIFEMGPDEVFSRIFHDLAGAADFVPNFDIPGEPVHLRQEIESLQRIFGNPFRYNSELPRRLSGISCPSLVIEAEYDSLVPRAVVEAYVEILPQSQRVMISGVGHGLAIERPALVANAIMDFVQSVD